MCACARVSENERKKKSLRKITYKKTFPSVVLTKDHCREGLALDIPGGLGDKVWVSADCHEVGSAHYHRLNGHNDCSLTVARLVLARSAESEGRIVPQWCLWWRSANDVASGSYWNCPHVPIAGMCWCGWHVTVSHKAALSQCHSMLEHVAMTVWTNDSSFFTPADPLARLAQRKNSFELSKSALVMLHHTNPSLCLLHKHRSTTGLRRRQARVATNAKGCEEARSTFLNSEIFSLVTDRNSHTGRARCKDETKGEFREGATSWAGAQK